MLFRRAAEQGEVIGQASLGVMYANGEGVPRDDVLSYLWINMAGANGSKEAFDIRNTLSTRMIPAQIEQAQELSRKCFEQNYKNCGM